MAKTLLPEVREHFSKSSEDYIAWRSWNLTNPELLKYGRVLEVGCGAKFSFESTLPKYGIDITPILLQELKRKSPEVNVIMADARFLPFRNSVFDTVGAVFVLHHLVGDTIAISKGNIRSSLSEMKRVLNAGGQILILEHLCKNKVFSLFFFTVTWFMAKLSINIKYLDIHDRVVTYFLDEKTFENICSHVGLKSGVVASEVWQFRRVLLGYDKQMLLKKKLNFGILG